MDRLKAETAGRTPLEDQRDADPEEVPVEDAGEGVVREDPVEDASADSFPASDPPSWTGSTTTGDDETTS